MPSMPSSIWDYSGVRNPGPGTLFSRQITPLPFLNQMLPKCSASTDSSAQIQLCGHLMARAKHHYSASEYHIQKQMLDLCRSPGSPIPHERL